MNSTTIGPAWTSSAGEAPRDFRHRVDEMYKSIDWDSLAKAGFDKHGDYCFIYSYPPVRALDPIPALEMFAPSPWEPVQDTINLYLHIPYCTGICSYCYFAKVIDDGNAPVGKGDYIELLIWEIGDKLQRYNPRAEIGTIHIGGGSPSTLTPEQIRRLMDYLGSLRLGRGAEITFECAPENIHEDLPKLRLLRECGVNRINVGAESLDDRVLKMMGRRHDSAATLRSIENARRAGFDNVNVDLIYGLTLETFDSWAETLRRCIDLGLDSISVYRLRKHPKKQVSRLRTDLFPAYEETMKMQLAHGILLGEAGYSRVQSHKYVLDRAKVQRQTERKRGIKHTQLLSAGCGAYGFLNGTFYWNTKSLADYAQKTRQGEHPTWIGRVLEKDDLMRKAFVLGVHTSSGIDLGAFRGKFGVDAREVFPAEIEEAVELGLFGIEGERIRVTELGYVFGDELSVKFYSGQVRSALSALGMKYGMFFERDRFA